MENPLSSFTNKYQLSKTLRFELKPVGSNGQRLSEEESNQLFKNILEQDRKIKAAYIALKPVLDKIHEDIINNSLTSDEAKAIDFSKYFEEYKKGKAKKIDAFEKGLREEIGSTFAQTIKSYSFTKTTKKKEEQKAVFEIKKDKPPIAQAEIIDYLLEKHKDNENLKSHIQKFKGFFGYFDGYNKNRANYYEYKKEASTAVATRIVHENLPKFCDNTIQFEIGKVQKKKNKDSEKKELPISRKDEYLNAYQFLKDNNRDTKIKDRESNNYIEAYPIIEDLFTIENFTNCLSQEGIESYNKVIGHYNLLINLYNQARKGEKDFNKLKEFTILYKQIGCGAKKELFEQIEDETELRNQIKQIVEAGKSHFEKQIDESIPTVYKFTKWLKENNDWSGVYWSKAALSKISNQYLTNWHSVLTKIENILKSKDKNDKEIKAALSSVATYKRGREEELKFNDAIELSGLFLILNQTSEENWMESFFKTSVLEDRKELLNKNLNPSENLLLLICADIEDNAKAFNEESPKILDINDFRNDDNIRDTKNWLDKTKFILWPIQYFSVKRNKIKGDSINTELDNLITEILRSKEVKWYDWYDLVRNYLSKKPQDDAKKNKLKLKFGKGKLLDGFVDSHTESDTRDNSTQYGGYIFRKKVEGKESEFEYFLGISKNADLFRCHLQSTIQENDKSEYERLEYYQAKPTTYFDTKYNDNKEGLVNEIEKLVNKVVGSNEQLKADAKKIKKRDKDGKITPTTLIDRIKNQDEFKSILNNDAIVVFVNKTIEDLKANTINFIVRAPRLQNVQNKEYSGTDGLKQIINDLQAIAKENRVFNFFNVSKKESAASFADEKKPLYLFKISNKDLNFSETSRKDENGKQKRMFKGNENLHTTLFRALMREFEGCETIDLGKGQIFFRESVENIKKEPTHNVGEKMLNRREKNTGNTIPYEIHNELYLLANKKIDIKYISNEAKAYLNKNNKIDESRIVIKDVKHAITKGRRFTEPKYQFHLSTILNFNPKNEDVNETVNNNFAQYPDIQFLGIDRGEKHLIYYSLLNAKGELISQGHFDSINNKDYLQAINDAAKRRREKQENWQQKGNISNLKDGYISLVVHEIIQKMKDKDGNYRPTFVVLEDLNTGFKRSRQKFEQQVYQKFELALAKKLNYLVDKSVKDINQIGSVANALQLTLPVANYQDIENRKQVGIMLYTRANYTSVTDPATGWRKTIYLKGGSEAEIKKQIVGTKENQFKDGAFSEIGFEGNDYFFTYTDKNSAKEWMLWSGKNGESLVRYRFKRGNSKNESIIESIDVKPLLDKLFEKFDKSTSLKTQLENGKELQKVNGHTVWETLRFVIDIIQQIRNSGDVTKKQDDNFLLSPVRNGQGEHFDSRKGLTMLPKDADANGAYNIARKGIIMYEHIKHLGDEWNRKVKIDGNDTIDLDLFISDKEWDLWLTNREKWKSSLNYFASKEIKDEKNK